MYINFEGFFQFFKSGDASFYRMVIVHVKDLISSNSKRISDPSDPKCPVTPSDTSSKRISRWLFFPSRKKSRSEENSIYTWSRPLEFLLQQYPLILLHYLEQLDMTTTVQPNQHHTKRSGLMDAPSLIIYRYMVPCHGLMMRCPMTRHGFSRHHRH